MSQDRQDESTTDAIRLRRVERGQVVYHAGEQGVAWRIVSGSVRLDREAAHGGAFAGLSLAGDVIGAETLLFGSYTYTAQALSGCVIEPWCEPAEARLGESMLRLLAAAERRMADILTVRSGKAGDRVGGLLSLLGSSGGVFKLPRLRDIADITDLTIETVSRTLQALDEGGLVRVEGQRQRRRIDAGQRPGAQAGLIDREAARRVSRR
ncbi:MAG: Crp/Fnr family transcriptional regulator [Rhodocyclaceae bacterium]